MPTRTRLRGVVFFIVGVLLLAAGIWAVVRQHDALTQAWDAARGSHWGILAALILLPAVNWALTSATFWVLTGRYGRVGMLEMSALIGSAWLLNHLPMRPGLVGRVAYHKSVNGIRVRDSIRVLVWEAACSAVGLAVMLGVVLAVGDRGGGWTIGAAVIVPLVAMAVMAGVLRQRGAQRGGADDRAGMSPPWVSWRLWAGMSLQYADMLVWAARYALAFWIIGRPISVTAAAAVAIVSQAAMFAPVQVGLREWVVGLTWALLPAWLGGQDPAGARAAGGVLASSAPGLLADFVNRAAELACVLPIGGVSAIWLWRRQRWIKRAMEERPPQAR